MAFRFLVLAVTVALTSSLQLPASLQTGSRMPAVRSAPASRAALFMCDAPEEPAAEAAPVAEKPPPRKSSGTPLEELVVGGDVTGKIRSVMTYGAFVDIGAATDALLHVSEITNEFVQDANEKLKAGESITAKIKAVNLEKKQIAITCKDPAERRPPRVKVDLSKYEGADDKEFITGKVNSITDFGAFVTIEEGVDGLVHISQVKEGGVGKVSDVLEVGQEVQVRVTQVDKSKRRIGLSMLPWTEQTEAQKKGRGGGGRFSDVGFGEADKEFQMSAEEVEALAVGDDFSSPFVNAFDRAALVDKVKAGKKRYARQVL